jgi:hypothetical protein
MEKTLGQTILGVIQWTIAILSVLGTVALFTWVEIVQRELDKYEHPFFEFSARDTSKGVELCIRSRIPDVLSPEYRLVFSDRDLQSTQFPWTFQKLLYDCLTDYVVELFTRSPMTGSQ